MSAQLKRVRNVRGAARRATEDVIVAPKREAIALLAYQFWQRRGCPIGSPEEDWYRAESELKHAEHAVDSHVAVALRSAVGNPLK